MRSWCRHEQESIRTALATVIHQSIGAARGQKTATMAWVRDEVNYAMGQKTPHSAAFFQMFHEEDAERGLRPPCLGEARGPLDRIQQGTAQEIIDHTFVPVQILHGLVPLLGELLVLGATPAERMSPSLPSPLPPPPHTPPSVSLSRERRLRSWLRHERKAVRTELAAALHHSAGPETNDAVRSEKTGVLEDPGPPQLGVERAVRPRSTRPSPLPFLGCGDVHDAAPVAFLVRQSLLQREKEEREEEERKKMELVKMREQIVEKFRTLFAVPGLRRWRLLSCWWLEVALELPLRKRKKKVERGALPLLLSLCCPVSRCRLWSSGRGFFCAAKFPYSVLLPGSTVVTCLRYSSVGLDEFPTFSM